eukprot:TRINITY_DN7510_c0_g1_i2.p1 TRINITY_DN7510_c0_g1~~TRINITY_DN7510_c0_g1_i2.p1  ORF type:complete len:110 (-),score=10.15 TRINITY_DN7510_c0_g1_i2:42-371(-)
MICALEWDTLGHKKLTYFTHLLNLYLAFVMLICRIHYSIDLLTGVVFGHYTYILISKYTPYIDNFFAIIYYKAYKYRSKKQGESGSTAQNDRLIKVPPPASEKPYEMEL